MPYLIDRSLLADVMQCSGCGTGLSIGQSSCSCLGCGREWPISEHGIVRDERVVGHHGSEDSDYVTETKLRYQSRSYAIRYLRRYSWPLTTGGAFYAAVIANRERKGIRQALRKAGSLKKVLDLPAGTGKLASVHSEFQYRVIAADVSAEMLEVGISEWEQWGNPSAMIQADATQTNFRDNAFHCVICLRLLHRLPLDVMEDVLSEVSRVASDWLILSNGVERKSIAGRIGPSPQEGRASLTPDQWRRFLSNYGSVETEYRVLPGLSKGVITLLRLP